MKISKKQLRRIIREYEVPHESRAFPEDHPDFQRGQDDAMMGYPAMDGATPEYMEGYYDGSELVSPRRLEELRRIIREGLADDAYEAGYNDALRDRPHGSNPDMRDLDPKSYDHGFDKGTAERMDLQRPLGTRGFYEGDLKEAFEETVAGRMSEYALYDGPGAEEAEADFDELMDEVAGFMSSARKRLDLLIQKHADLGAEDTESMYMIYDKFEKAVGSK